jgi:6-phosphofructokinase
MSVGILTSGGDAPGMNAAVRAAFRSLKMRAPDSELMLFRDGFRGLAGRLDSASDRSVDRKDVRDIIHRGGTFIGTGRVSELLLPPPDAPDRAERLAAREAFLRVAAVNLFQTQVESLMVIGGDGSVPRRPVIAEAYRATFPKRPFRVIGIPGTIDNDLYGTDFSIGYDTALNNVVDSIRKLRDTIESHRRAIILEVMGNTSGWLALQSAIAGGAAAVAIPEVEETWDRTRSSAPDRRRAPRLPLLHHRRRRGRAQAGRRRLVAAAQAGIESARRSTTSSATRWRPASTRSATSPAAAARRPSTTRSPGCSARRRPTWPRACRCPTAPAPTAT